MKISASIHVVRRYGPVGGMERYVWELTHALIKQGQKVRVICEQADKSADNAIEIIELGLITPKPRWVSMLRFSKRVSQYISGTNVNGWIIHSHERCAEHHVTTFHGPSILSRKKRVLDFLSPRIVVWEFLEKRELLNESVKAILPNSLLVSNHLAELYPSAQEKLNFPAYPGVSESFTKISRFSDKNTIGFIGKEWQRKGLIFAIKCIEALNNKGNAIKLIVAGPVPSDIEHLFTKWDDQNYQLEGWKPSEKILNKIDVLIHPAEVEPFGMAIAEANAVGIPVIISEKCGIAELIDSRHGMVLPLESTDEWQKEILKQLTRTNVASLELTWENLSTQHHQLYLKIEQGM